MDEIFEFIGMNFLTLWKCECCGACFNLSFIQPSLYNITNIQMGYILFPLFLRLFFYLFFFFCFCSTKWNRKSCCISITGTRNLCNVFGSYKFFLTLWFEMCAGVWQYRMPCIVCSGSYISMQIRMIFSIEQTRNEEKIKTLNFVVREVCTRRFKNSFCFTIVLLLTHSTWESFRLMLSVEQC